jgi:hypothetical protein
MPNQIQAGTMIVHQSAIFDKLDVESEPYCRNWRSLGILDSSGLDRKARAQGRNLFFMAGEIRAVVPAWGGYNNTLRRGVKRLLAQTRRQHLNCLEVTHILRKHFLGVPYISIAGHSRHLQKGSLIQSNQQRAQDAATIPAEPTPNQQ